MKKAYFKLIPLLVVLIISCKNNTTSNKEVTQKEIIRNSKISEMYVIEYKFNNNIIDTTTKRIQQYEEYDSLGNTLKSTFYINKSDSILTTNIQKERNVTSFIVLRGSDTTKGSRTYNNDGELVEIVKYKNNGWKIIQHFEYKNNKLIQQTQTDWKGDVIYTTNNKYNDDVGENAHIDHPVALQTDHPKLLFFQRV